MEKKDLSMLTYEDYEWDECVSAWDSRHEKELETRKYAQDFNPKYSKVQDWVYDHKEEVRNLTGAGAALASPPAPSGSSPMTPRATTA